MNLYPAMRAHMGRWHYYMVKMNMRELAESVKFATTSTRTRRSTRRSSGSSIPGA